MSGHTPFKVLRDRLLADPTVEAEYEAQQAEFKALRKEIMEQTSKSLEYLHKTGD
jgi:hypothetical protein